MKKRLMILAGAVLTVVVLGAAVVVPAFAQEETPPAEAPFGGCRGGGFGRSIGGQVGLEAAAELLGMTADELSNQLWGGKTLADLAEEAGVELQTLRDAVEAANQAAMQDAIRDAIEQALENGYITQDQADWLLLGLEQGFLPMGRSFGFGGGFGMRGGHRGGGMGFGQGTESGFGRFAPRQTPSFGSSSSSL